MSHDRKIAVVGLYCVGLVAAFVRAGNPAIGFDIDVETVRELRADLKRATLDLTSDKSALDGADFFSNTVPTRSMLPIGPIWVPCSRPRAAPVVQEIAGGEK